MLLSTCRQPSAVASAVKGLLAAAAAAAAGDDQSTLPLVLASARVPFAARHRLAGVSAACLARVVRCAGTCQADAPALVSASRLLLAGADTAREYAAVPRLTSFTAAGAGPG